MAEISGTNVLILRPLAIRVCQKVSGSTSFEVPDRRSDMPVREVNETIATENYIDARQFVAAQVEHNESRALIAVDTLVVSDEFGNDVDTDVLLKRHESFFHPIEIAARRVEH